MKIEVLATACNAKFVSAQPLKWLRVNRTSKLFKEYLFQKKFRDGNRDKSDQIDEKKYCQKITFRCTTYQSKNLYIQKEDTAIVITAFNKQVRNLFYTDFFVYMDRWMLHNEYSLGSEFQIREIAINFMRKYNLMESDVKLQTLLRNYRRYREDPNNSLDDVLEKISEDDISD